MNISVILPFLILTLGAFLLIKLRFFFILHPINTIRCAFGKGSRREGAITLALSLAGTLGVGNIVGVASAIAIGGAGSVLWLMLSALFSSAIKYSEISLSIKSGGEGIMGVLRAEFGHGGRLLSVLYASLCLTLSLHGMHPAGRSYPRRSRGGKQQWYALYLMCRFFSRGFCMCIREKRHKTGSRTHRSFRRSNLHGYMSLCDIG